MESESIEQQALNATEVMVANSLMMINVYSKKRGLFALISQAKWESRLRYWKKRRKVLTKLVESKN